ncbi:Glycoside family 76 [Cordyceps militaris]|uniref:Glycoside family 76 n=1 Tax=Cordyceps militaris TaxID=73501 RepID=A0A2H4SBB1_CORMI|nr:Glycoside family 76 [Cordyceps militaris]
MMCLSRAASLLLVFATHIAAEDKPIFDKVLYSTHASLGLDNLHKTWYNNNTGLWGELWWNSANALTTVCDLVPVDQLSSRQCAVNQYRVLIENTFSQAQHVEVRTFKSRNLDNGGMMESHYCINGVGGACALKRDGSLIKRGFKNFLNNFYDDEGWWALALIRAWDVTNNQTYLEAAATIFEDMKTGLGGPCNGGIYWSKDRQYVNAIANELYLTVAASLAVRVPGEKTFLQTAKDQWSWFSKSGMINSDNLINDGLDGNCKNNGQATWTYNQGVILGGLVELSRATNDKSLLDEASKIAKAAIGKFSNKDGILEENGGCEYQPGRCGQDGQQFKGVFIRNLNYLQLAAPDEQFRSFILKNADAIWDKDCQDCTSKDVALLGVAWAGPYFNATMPTQSSALDAIVAAVYVAPGGKQVEVPRPSTTHLFDKTYSKEDS